MYAGSFLYLLATPLALGSWWGLLAVAGLAPFLAWRLFDEERFLKEKLPGYADYCSEVAMAVDPGRFLAAALAGSAPIKKLTSIASG